MMLIRELIKKDMLHGQVGIEIEAEGVCPAVFSDIWNSVVDNSLREGMEYVLNVPIEPEQVRPAITALKKQIKGQNGNLQFSFRTSVHIHINVRELTDVELFNFIYTYSILENFLMWYCGEQRKANRFCLRLSDSEFFVEKIRKSFRNGIKDILTLDPNGFRYAALNLAAVQTYGSLEFRSMEGNLDTDRITGWVDILLAIREFAKSKKTPYDVYEAYMQNPEYRFAKLVLGDLVVDKGTEEENREIAENFSLTVDFPFEFKYTAEKPRENVELKGKRFEAAFLADLADIVPQEEGL